MKRILLISFVLMSSLIGGAWAQQTVSGKVTSGTDGEGLPGVSVRVKGTSTGVTTDLDGKYRLQVPEDAETLVFSFVGFLTEEVQVGNRSVVDVELMEDIKQLQEVIITANAIEREKRELGYSVATVEGEEFTKARDANLLNSLSGKVAGVRITQQSGTPGGSSKILIRGANSLTGNNEPLFVVDGMPISNSAFNGTRGDIISGGADVGSRAGDINPDDIESMTVLKGASATALYGSRAANGAIIITTKRGKKNRPATVSVNSSLRFDKPLKLPQYQNEYGPGDFGEYDDNLSAGWGPKISEVQNQTFEDFKGDDVRLQAYPDNVENWYETGVTLINSVGVSGGTEKNDYRLGYTHLDQTGIVPESGLKRNTIALNAGSRFSDKISSRISVNYVRTQGFGRPRQGGNNPNILSSLVHYIPRTLSMEDLRNNIVDEAGNAIGQNTNNTVNNPFWVARRNPVKNTVERVFGNAQIGYDPFDWLNITGRAGTDFYTENRSNIVSKGTLNLINGQFINTELFSREVQTDLIATATKNVNDDIVLKGIIGHQVNQRTTRRTIVDAQSLSVAGLYNYANAESTSPTNFSSIRRLYGMYFDLGLDYRNYLFVNVTGRNDWSSTLPEANNSYFYPSISSSFIFTDAFNISNNILTLGKLRANYANVGNDTDPYNLAFTYQPLADIFTQFLPFNTYPHGGQLAFTGPLVIPPGDNLVPENQISWEIGTELQFFKGRIGLDATYYSTITEDQILAVSIPQSTGFESKRINAGSISNRGIELMLNVNPLSPNSPLQWNVQLNYGKNKQSVDELAPGLEEFALTSGFSGLSVRAEPGQAFGLYGNGWARDSVSGKVIINPATGLRVAGSGRQRMGDIYPEWTLGVNNNFSYKGINVSFLVDVRQGGVLWSNTVQALRGSGLAEETLVNRGQVFVDEGVIENEDGTFSENNVPVQSMQQFWTNYTNGSLTESGVFDASFVKLREVRIGYSLLPKWIAKTPFSKIDIGIEGRNLWIIKDHVPHIDPEVNFFGPGLTGEGVEFNSVPSARSLGFNLRFTL